MMKKQKILETIKDLPNEVNLNDLFEQLWVAEKIERGLEQIEKGEMISQKKVVEHFKKKWGK